MAASQSEALKAFQVAFSQLDEGARTRFLDALQDPPPPVKPPWIASASASQDTTQPGSASALPSTAQPGTGLSTDEPSASPMPSEERPWAGLIDGGPAQRNAAAIQEPQIEEEEPLTPPPCPWPFLQESCYHQPRPSTDSCWTAWDGSWWANYWDSTNQEPPDESDSQAKQAAQRQAPLCSGITLGTFPRDSQTKVRYNSSAPPCEESIEDLTPACIRFTRGLIEPSLGRARQCTALRQLETPAQPGYKRRARLVRIKGWVVLGWSSACFL